MEKIVERTIAVADVLNESAHRFPPNMVFKQKGYQITVPMEIESKVPMGQIKLFGEDKTLGTIVVNVDPGNVIVNVPEGPARNYGKYLADELSIFGYPSELRGKKDL